METPFASGSPFGNLVASGIAIGKNVTLSLSDIDLKPNQSKTLFSVTGGVIDGDFSRIDLRVAGDQKSVDYLSMACANPPIRSATKPITA